MNIEKISRFIKEKREALFKSAFFQSGLLRGSPLRITLFSGLMLVVLITGILIVVFFTGGRSRSGEGDGFYRLLHEYDLAAERYLEQREFESMNRELDRLEKKAGAVESWLSVLKRRRQLAHINPRLVPAWRQSARRAALAYPWSEPVAALAAEALIHEAAITPEAETELRSYLRLMTDPVLNPLRLSIHVLLGDLKNPERAATLLPQDMTMEQFSVALWRATLPSAREIEALATDFAIVKVLRGNISGAAAEIQGILSGYFTGPNVPPSADFVRFAAEFAYDFADLSRSAELFSRLPGAAALSRQADALWLAGYSGSARMLWTMLATPEPAASDSELSGLSDLSADANISARSLYNLALTSETPKEATVFLERLIALRAASGSPGRIYGCIRYSRLLNAPRAIAFLEAGKSEILLSKESAFLLEPEFPVEALIDLEIIRRRMEIAEQGRLVAETWLLLGRYPKAESLYRWAAWYYSLQRNYNETVVLLKTAARHQFSGEWIQLHEALQLIREDNLDRAGEILSAIPAENADWPVAANLGRILEVELSPVRAIEKYETAIAALPGNREIASRIQVRIAQCLKSMGRISDSRRVLEYALDLNPDNLNARLELNR
ncbi:MAG: hypothetical protein LBH97_07785 [Treponema sp.]|jgi:hypothetical protein|nr:hypothetical protein [Treponema sp.]